jgi:hypothetical protein
MEVQKVPSHGKVSQLWNVATKLLTVAKPFHSHSSIKLIEICGRIVGLLLSRGDKKWQAGPRPSV